MRIHELHDRNVLILGYGREGTATVQALQEFAPTAHITIADQNADIPNDVAHVTWQLGDSWLQGLQTFDCIIKSPGIPLLPELAKHAAKITSSVQIFLETIHGSGAIVIGVTGSKGKSTTSALIHTLLKAAGRDAHLVGNIGDASIAHINTAKKDTIFVHELSSYQLLDLTASPHIAVITSFFPEHLNYHGSIDAYMDAKKRVCRFQTAEDATYFNADSPGAASIATEGQGRKIPVTVDDCPIELSETKLIGEHNRENIALAWKVVEDLGVTRDIAVAALKQFEPLRHRLQSLGIHAGIEWVDDAISTTPESAIAALDALGDRVRTIILGGQDRGSDFTHLAQRLKDSHVQTALIFPGSGPRIREAIEQTTTSMELIDVASMDEAVSVACQKTPHETPPAITLLSTASPSYGMFTNFEDKGDRFQKLVSGL